MGSTRACIWTVGVGTTIVGVGAILSVTTGGLGGTVGVAGVAASAVSVDALLLCVVSEGPPAPRPPWNGAGGGRAVAGGRVGASGCADRREGTVSDGTIVGSVAALIDGAIVPLGPDGNGAVVGTAGTAVAAGADVGTAVGVG